MADGFTGNGEMTLLRLIDLALTAVDHALSSLNQLDEDEFERLSDRVPIDLMAAQSRLTEARRGVLAGVPTPQQRAAVLEAVVA